MAIEYEFRLAENPFPASDGDLYIVCLHPMTLIEIVHLDSENGQVLAGMYTSGSVSDFFQQYWYGEEAYEMFVRFPRNLLDGGTKRLHDKYAAVLEAAHRWYERYLTFEDGNFSDMESTILN